MSIVRTRSALPPTTDVIDDIEAEDDECGPEAEEHHRVVADLMLGMARQTDSRIPLERQARRTLGQMVPGAAVPALLVFAPRPKAPDVENVSPTAIDAQRRCTGCSGKGGRMVDTSSGGVTRQSWRQCTSCRGSGVAR